MASRRMPRLISWVARVWRSWCGVTCPTPAALATAYHIHPERFRRPPAPPKLPTIAWINQPPEIILTR
jgi:hypothetical protein